MSKLFILIFTPLLLTAACDINLNSGREAKPQAAQSVQNSIETNYSVQLGVGEKNILVEIADTPTKLEQGLSGRGQLTDAQGMLFKFEQKTMPGFWMKDMKFDLDLIWVADGKIVGITQNIPAPKSPAENLSKYFPPSQVDWVLEVNAGWTNKNRINVGDEVKLEDN